MEVKTDQVLDAKGLACPMPIVKTKKALEDLEPGQVVEVQATDKGSTADIQAWARSTGNQYLGTNEEGEVLQHYLRKAKPDEEIEQQEYPHTVNLDDLESKIEEDEAFTLLDVREPAEYAFGHIQGAYSIPLGELDGRMGELDPSIEVLVICRTGNRSGLAAQLLSEQGFENVRNVVPGMSEWDGSIEQQD